MNSRIFRYEVRDELLAIVREPAALFFTVLMPVAFFALFAAMFGGEGGFGAGSLATYGAFAALSVVMMNPGISFADSRERGWLRVKSAFTTATPIVCDSARPATAAASVWRMLAPTRAAYRCASFTSLNVNSASGSAENMMSGGSIR